MKDWKLETYRQVMPVFFIALNTMSVSADSNKRVKSFCL